MMARGGSVGYKRKARNNVRLEKRGSDESDEDYKVDEDEFDQSEDEYCSSLAEDESNESLGDFEEDEEDEWVEKKVKKVTKPRGRKNNGVVKRRKKKASYKEDEEEEEDYDNEDDDDDDDDDDDGFVDVNHRKNNEILKPRRKTVSYKEEDKEEEDYDDDDDNDCADVSHRKNNGVMKQRRKISYKEEDVDYDDDDFADVKKIKVSHKEEEDDGLEIFHRQKEDELVDEQAKRTDIYVNTYNENPRKLNKPTSRKKKTTRGRRRKVVVNSDSDFVSSQSDFEFTLSEEERDQVIEASEFCRTLATSSKMIKEEEILPPERKQARKGKEKVVDMKIELVKQVCGICLSEEGKKTVKGVLNCCSHYFCFACIMEWSKVESRCPLCKQRFTTINRTTRGNGGSDLSDAVFPVPECDQVYQPSEEELWGFLDPYESVICTECHQDGDDAYMLLCDLCDSPAHTYCVGLGREVPDGNWYCDGCSPTLASSNGQTLIPTPDHGPTNNLSIGQSPVSAVRVTFDLNEVYVPDTPLAEHSQIQSPRNYGDFQGASPGYGFGALTLYERRRIQRQIHRMLNNRIRQSGVGPLSGVHLFGSPIGQGGVIAPQPDVTARMAPQNMYLSGRLQEYNTHSVFSPRLSLREQALHNQASTSTNHPFGGLLDSEFGGGFSHQQLQPCSGGSNTGSDVNTSPYQFREATVPSRTLQGSLNAPF